MPCTGWAFAFRIERASVVGITRVPHVADARGRVGARRSASPGGDDTIEHIDTPLDSAKKVVRGAYTHQIAGCIGWYLRQGDVQRGQHGLLSLPNRQPP